MNIPIGLMENITVSNVKKFYLIVLWDKMTSYYIGIQKVLYLKQLRT